jgi:hypothetical protein
VIDFIPCKWTGFEWIVKTCPCTSGRESEFEEALDKIKNELPVPKWTLNAFVEFSWMAGTMTGKISEIEVSWWEYRPEDIAIYYTIYANGHGRWGSEETIIKQIIK